MYQEINETSEVKTKNIVSPPFQEGVLVEREEEKEAFDLEKAFLHLSNNDYISYREACTGIYIRGSTGSGKSTAIKVIARSAFRDGVSALVITSKEGEAEEYAECAAQAGREKDVRIIEKGSPHTFNIFSHEAKATVDKADIPVALGTLIEQLHETNNTGTAEKDFWVESSKLWTKKSFGLLLDAGEEDITLQKADDIINSIPTHPDMILDLHWQQNSSCAYYMLKAEEREKAGLMSEQEKKGWHERKKFFYDLSTLPNDTRASIFATHLVQISSLRGGTAEGIVLGTPTLTPEEVFEEGLIVIVNLPIQKYSFIGRNLSKLIKYWFMVARQRFSIEKDANDNPYIPPFLLLADEYQLYCSQSQDSRLFGVMRSSGTIFLASSQSDNSLWEVMDSRKANYQAGAILTNLSNKFVLNLSDPFTCENVASDIGKVHQKKHNFNFSRNFGNSPTQGGGSAGSSFHEEYTYILPPVELTTLNKPNMNNLYSECVFYSHGKKFSTGNNFIRMAFTKDNTMALEGVESHDNAPNAFDLFFRGFVSEVSKLALESGKKALTLVFGLVKRLRK